jgi:transcriptional regulator
MPKLQDIWQFVREQSFGILFSAADDGLKATHLPFVLDADCGTSGALLSHFAKANPHWKALDQQSVLVVFPGPHAFVSSDWYEAQGSVPTWNYTAVHVYGRVEVLSERSELKELMYTMLKAYEPNSRLALREDDADLNRLLEAIVGFRIHVLKWEGKRKLDQNHPVEQQQKVIAALRMTADTDSHKIAELMAANLEAIADTET